MSYHRDADVTMPMVQNVNELPDVEDTVPVTSVSQNLLESKTLQQNKLWHFGKEYSEVVERTKERVGGNVDIRGLLVRKSH